MSEWITLEIDKYDWKRTRVHTQPLPQSLETNEVLLRIDSQALTANNITYAALGDTLGYWGFFPADAGWGRLPAMSWADVIRSNHPEIAEGERVWGSFPFSTHLKVVAGNATSASFFDVSPHRAEYAPLYAQIDRASANAIYDPAREEQDILLRGLFITSWLVEDFLEQKQYFDAESCLITSASSKTGIALAYSIKKRGKTASIGITSPRNIQFCQSLGCYDEVLSYADSNSLDASRPAVLVDMTGNPDLLRNVHTHYGNQLRYSCRVGETHHENKGPVNDLPGPRPIFFFAPGHFQSRSAEVGVEKFLMLPTLAFFDFRIFADEWLVIDRNHGPHAATLAYQKVLAGRVDPTHGQVISMHNPM